MLGNVWLQLRRIGRLQHANKDKQTLLFESCPDLWSDILERVKRAPGERDHVPRSESGRFASIAAHDGASRGRIDRRFRCSVIASCAPGVRAGPIRRGPSR